MAHPAGWRGFVQPLGTVWCFEMNGTSLLSWPVWAALWALGLSAALFFRPLLPVDETRYVGVAWEMWLRGDFLVPYLNWEPYSHKPPLLFWLINLGWGIFGVNDWWPRLVAPLFALGNLSLTVVLARRLWPGEAEIHRMAPFFLVGAAFWGLFGTLTMFDMILAFWTLVGLIGLTDAWAGRSWRGWSLFALAIGLGVLSKGPVILLHLCPAALLEPYWTGRPWAGSWRRWHGWFLGALVAGAGLALLWAVPAAWRGGEAYGEAIFWGQSAGRMVQSFAHGKPVWWYLAILPGLVLPWLLWPSLLRGLWRLIRPSPDRGARRRDAGLRLIAVWGVSSLVIFSLISGKRPHYLIPLFPALALGAALLVARLGAGAGRIKPRLDMAPAVIFLLAGAGAIAALPYLAPALGYAQWGVGLEPLWLLPLVGGGLWLLYRPPRELGGRVAGLALLSVLAVAAVQGVVRDKLAQAYDLRPLANHLAKLQDEGRAIAHYGKYHGQFNFLGRLERPLAIIGDGEVVHWIKRNPGGKIVSYRRQLPVGAKPDFAQPFRGRVVAVWDGAAVLADPSIAKRGAE